ncbi:MAG: hypothetical protein H5U06_05490 [Candidatus Aminicenantes bacterium]|nr:hypothetical protein [Candidatus Aminicenantes bacterium]
MYMYALFSVIVLVLSFYLFKKAAGTMSLLRLNIVSFIFYVQLFILTFIGINLSLFGVYHYRISLASKQSLFSSYFAVCYVMLIMPSSMILAQKLLFRGEIKKKLHNYLGSRLRPLQSEGDNALVLYCVVLSVIAFFATIYTFSQIKELPMVAVLVDKVDPVSFNRLRIEASKEFSGNIYIRNLFSLFLGPFVSYIAYAYNFLYKSLRYKLWFYFTAIVALMALLSTGEKALPIEYLITIFIIKSTIKGKSSVKDLIKIVVLTLGLILGFYVLITGRLDVSINSGPLGRLLMGQVAALPLTFDIFPRIHPFLNGGSFPAWLSSMLGVEHARSARLLMEIFSPLYIKAGAAGVMNTLFIAEAWANFGFIGLLLAPVIVGVIVQFVYNQLISLPKTPVFLAVIGYFIFGFPITGGFVDFLWNPVWLFMVAIILLGIYISSLSFRKSFRRGRLKNYGHFSLSTSN